MKHSIKWSVVATTFMLTIGATTSARADFSDSLTIFDGTGAIVDQIGTTEALEVALGPDHLYHSNLNPGFFDQAQFGNFTNVVEGDGSSSDIFGLASGGPNGGTVLSFGSDTETDPVPFGFLAPIQVPEPLNGVLDATMYLNPFRQAKGWTATFISRDVPEPTSISLLGLGGVGLLTYARRHHRRASVAA